MAFPKRLLAEDEKVMVHVHPHWKTLLVTFLVMLIAVGGGVAGIFFVQVPLVRWIIAGAAVLILLVFTVRPLLRWATTHFVITTHRVLVRVGIFSRSGRDVPLSRINDVSFQHGLLERMLGCGTLVVESAGERGQVVLTDIPRVERVQATLYRLVEEDAARRI